VIVVDSLVATRAVHAATGSTPIIMMGGADPIRAGTAESLARPGGNVTGITSQTADRVVARLLSF
jgi:putative ABC transport system substrate-binding protein